MERSGFLPWTPLETQNRVRYLTHIVRMLSALCLFVTLGCCSIPAAGPWKGLTRWLHVHGLSLITCPSTRPLIGLIGQIDLSEFLASPLSPLLAPPGKHQRRREPGRTASTGRWLKRPSFRGSIAGETGSAITRVGGRYETRGTICCAANRSPSPPLRADLPDLSSPAAACRTAGEDKK